MASIDSRTDAELIAAIARGEDRAFETLYLRHKEWVVRLAYRFLHQESDALDVLQETFSYLLKHAPRLYLSGKLKTFLYPVVKNSALAIKRKRRSMGGEEMLENLVAPEVARSELGAILQKLPAMHQEVVLMRFVDDLSLEEMAQALSIPLGTAKSRLHHAIASLRADPSMKDRLIE